MGKKHSKAQNSNVIQMPSRCLAEGCSQKSQRADFCNEHFEWFKEGLINKKGQKPTDFDKKYQHYLGRKQKAA